MEDGRWRMEDSRTRAWDSSTHSNFYPLSSVSFRLYELEAIANLTDCTNVRG